MKSLTGMISLCLLGCISAAVIPAAPPAKAQPEFYGDKFYYYGAFPGKCASKDGMYYHDAYSFVICSNGNAYVQPCAAGTRNRPDKSYVKGSYYKQGDFCNENLNDYGYGAYHSRPYYFPAGFPYNYAGFPYNYAGFPYNHPFPYWRR